MEYSNNELGSNLIRKGVMMSCCRNRCRCRCRRRDRDRDDDIRGIQRIALRGPGCISGTGRCEGVLGDRDRCCRCHNVLGTGGFRCSNEDLLGIRDRDFRCSNSHVLGTGGRRSCGQVFGTGGGFQCNDVRGSGRRRRCHCHDWKLSTPTTVPR